MHGAMVSIIAAFAGVAGCAPPRFADGAARVIQQSGVRNAAWRTVRGLPCLRVNACMVENLGRAAAAGDTATARVELTSALEKCHQAAQYAMNNEWDRLPPGALTRLWSHYFAREPIPNDLREALRSRYWRDADAAWKALSDRVAAAPDRTALVEISQQVVAAVEPAVTARHGRGPLLTLVAGTIREATGPPDHGGPLVDVYEPEGTPGTGAFAHGVAQRDVELLARFAPIVVQERMEQARYPTDTDCIGTVVATGTAGSPHVEVDTSRPAIYAYAQEALFDDRPRLQLTYVYWFPRHPALKPLDAEAGRLEGATLRITLDSSAQPAVFETVLNCGCYHRCYVSEALEQASCSAYGRPEPGKHYCVERTMEDRIDWIVPETVDTTGGAGRPILFSRAGYHGPAGIEYDPKELDDRMVQARKTYALRSYEELEQLPVSDGRASLFLSNGLVRDAGRLEGWLLWSTGMLDAGRPRQRGTQLIHWDQYEFDDPHLLEKCLRLPSDL